MTEVKDISNPQLDSAAKKDKSKCSSTWKVALPLIVIMLLVVLMLQNFMLNYKLVKLSGRLEQVISDNTMKNQDLITALDKKFNNLFGGVDTNEIKENKASLSEIKDLLQDIKGMGFDGSISQADIVVEDTGKATKIPEKKLEALNIETYVQELDKLKKQIIDYDQGHEVLRKEIYDISEQLITDYNVKNGISKTEGENGEQSLFAGFVKVRKINQEQPDDFIESVKSSITLFENGEYPAARLLLEQVNLQAKNDKLTEFLLKLKEFEVGEANPGIFLSKLKNIITAIKEDIAK